MLLEDQKSLLQKRESDSEVLLDPQRVFNAYQSEKINPKDSDPSESKVNTLKLSREYVEKL